MKEWQKVRRQIKNANRRIEAQAAEAAPSKRDGHKDDLGTVLQATAEERRSAPPEGVPQGDAGTERSTDTNQQSSGSQNRVDQNSVDQNGPEDAVHSESPPLQPIVAIGFPLCDAAVRKCKGGDWDLADATLAECSETGEDGVRNDSYAKIEAMRKEIAKNHGVELSFERVRKLRKVASAFPPFPPGRRRPGVSLEGHLEAGTPEALEKIINNAPEGTALTREFIRTAKNPDERADQENQKKERRHQIEDQREALQNLCQQLEREKEQREQRYTDLCRSIGREPEPFAPPLPLEPGASGSADDLEQSLRVLLMSRGYDPTAGTLRQAIQAFVTAVVKQ
jgi:hypothetical protein